MASNKKQSCVGVDSDTRTSTDQPGFLIPHSRMTSAPNCRRVCQFCQSIKCVRLLNTTRSELVCTSCSSCVHDESNEHLQASELVCAKCHEICRLQPTTAAERRFCSCCNFPLAKPPPPVRPQCRPVSNASSSRTRQVLYGRRSLSLPGSTKNSYDVVVSQGLSRVGPSSSSSSTANQTVGHYRPVKKVVSYNLKVKMEIELELAKSVPDEFKSCEVHTVPGTKCQMNNNGNDDLTEYCDVCCSDESVSSVDEDIYGEVYQDLGFTCHASSTDASGIAPSVKLTPNVVCDHLHNRKRLGRSHSWSHSTSLCTLDSADKSSETQKCLDLENGVLSNKREMARKMLDGNDSVGQDEFRSIVAGSRRRCRNGHTSLPLNEQEIQALEAHLEQNLYVPVQLLIGSRGSRRKSQIDNDNSLFVLAEAVMDECCVCLSITLVRQRNCCTAFVCDECLRTYMTTMVNQRLLGIQCPRYTCNKYLSRAEVSHHLDHSTRDKFNRFILEANCEPHMKTCPNCNHVLTLDKELRRKKRLSLQEAKVVCQQCGIQWCFPCHAPWHDGLTCKEFWKGDRLLKDWAKERPRGVINAHRCPKCKIFIQRSSGCDHMTCSKCGTQFCYQCGGRFRGISYFGNHYSRYSIFGCKYRYKPDLPVERKMIRGAIFGCQLLGTPFCVGLIAAGGCVVIPLALVVVPTVYGGVKLQRYLGRQKERRRKKKIENEDKELGVALPVKRYERRHTYGVGERQIEVSYP